MGVRRINLSSYILGICVTAFVLNPILRVFFNIDGFFATFLAAALAALLLRVVFQIAEKRSPSLFEAFVICSIYTALVLISYVGMWSLMSLQDVPGPFGEMAFVLHALSYPVLAFVTMFSLRKPPIKNSKLSNL